MPEVWLPSQQLMVMDTPGLDRAIGAGDDLDEAVRTDAFTADVAVEVRAARSLQPAEKVDLYGDNSLSERGLKAERRKCKIQ